MRSLLNRQLKKAVMVPTLIGALAFSAIADACTRVVYLGEGNRIITARSMDWKKDIETNLWIFPRGIERTGEVGPNSIKWTSKYGSVISSGYDIATTDGLNEKGLMANVLWLVESKYPTFTEKSKPGLTLAAWAQYVLDNFATVEEAVTALKQEPYTIVTAEVPGETRLATLHLSLSDASGDSAIIEYIDGKQVIHHNRTYQVMTNSPTFEHQLALNEYWQQIGGETMLPGTNRAADRFVRASYYVNRIPQAASPEESIASMFGVIRNASVPYGISTPDQPNISSTRWRTLADHKNQLYFFESALSPSIFWVDLKKVDFSSVTGQTKQLKLEANQARVLSGEVSQQFKPHAPFKFLGL